LEHRIDVAEKLDRLRGVRHLGGYCVPYRFCVRLGAL
jgi:hypothetical protein